MMNSGLQVSSWTGALNASQKFNDEFWAPNLIIDWGPESKPEIQMNGECEEDGYTAEEHYLPLESLCQKVIVPVSYITRGQKLFKLIILLTR